MKFRIGVDLGGTNTVAAAVNERNEVVYKKSVPTKRRFYDICRDIKELAFTCCEVCGIHPAEMEYMGVGSPGIIDPDGGRILRWSVKGISDAPLRDKLFELTGMPVYIENDANAAALGEYEAGAGRGTTEFIAITVGTGIGCGAIINGELYRGMNFAALEPGHMVIDKKGPLCSCGRKGCFEAIASASALMRRAKKACEVRPDTALRNYSVPDGRAVFEAAAKGDLTANQLLDSYLKDLACGLTNIVNLFQPQVLCIGGGISAAGDALLLPLREQVAKEEYSKTLKTRTVIKLAELGNDAGLIGAALLGRGKTWED